MDVRLELDPDALAAQPDPPRFVLEAARAEADALCERSGARLRTDRAPEILIKEGQHRITGRQCVLVATRWAVTAPDNTPTGAPT